MEAKDTNQEKKIFISWSKNYSKQIALELKKAFEETIFKNCGLKAFVSDIDLQSGSDWYNAIKDELKSSEFGIICITKENKEAPWLQFEAGALISNDMNVTPILFHCAWLSSDENNPLKNKQSIPYTIDKFVKLVKDINKKLNLMQDETQLEVLAKAAFDSIEISLKTLFSQMETEKNFSMKYVFPRAVKIINKDTVYVSAPMASLSDTNYSQINLMAQEVVKALKEIGIKDVKCPAADINSNAKFDGSTHTFKVTFEEMKKRDCYVLLYPEKIASGVLIELGYAIALTKRIVIFTKNIDDLPYIVQQPNAAANIKIYTYTKMEDISKIIKSNSMTIFDDNNEDDV